MSKLIELRVQIAVSEDVDLKEVKPLLRKLVADKGSVSIEAAASGEADVVPAQGLLDGIGRRTIHWGTIEVLQGKGESKPKAARVKVVA